MTWVSVLAPPGHTIGIVPAHSVPVDWPLKLSLKIPFVALTISSCFSLWVASPFCEVVTTARGPVTTCAEVPSPNHGSSVKLNFRSPVSTL